jgi:predicted kinase
MLYVVIGPPAAGKSMWVLTRARPADIVIDFDRLTHALAGEGISRNPSSQLRTLTRMVRKTAIDIAVKYVHDTDIYIIECIPNAAKMRWYTRIGAQLITIDPGRDVVLERCKRERPAYLLDTVYQWYNQGEIIPAQVAVSREW